MFLVRAIAAAEHGRRAGTGPGLLTPLQSLLDEPMLHSEHAPSSFHPRRADPNVLVVEERVPEHVVQDLRARGHEVRVTGGWQLGRTCLVGSEGGFLRAAANARGEQGYAAGR